MEQRPNNSGSNSKRMTNKTVFKLIVGLVIVLAAGGTFFQMKSMELNRLRAVGLGPNTCFFRINQTFTARMINDSSSRYLSKEFITDTENCMADLAGLIPANESVLKQRVNHLAAITHQFHNSLEMAKTVFTRNSTDSVGPMSYYKKLEATKFEIENLLDKNAKKMESFLSRLQWPLFSALFLLVLVSLPLFSTPEPVRSSLAESAAHHALQATIIHENRILAARDRSTAKITAQTQNLQMAPAEAKLISNTTIEEKTTVPTQEVQQTVAKLIPLAELNLTETIAVEEIISKSLERLAPIIFSEGITIDLKLNEKAIVQADKEEIVDQIVFQVLTAAVKVIRPCNALAITLDQFDEGFSLEATATVRPGVVIAESPAIRTGLDITKALASEAGLDFTTATMKDQQGAMIGMKISMGTNLMFQQNQAAAATSTPKLVRVKKATKRELLQEFGEI